MVKMDGGEGGEIKREPAPGGRPWADAMKLRASERHICPFPSVYCGSRSSAKHWTVARIWPPTSDSAVAVCHWWSREGGGGWAINVAGRHVARSSGGSPTQRPTGLSPVAQGAPSRSNQRCRGSRSSEREVVTPSTSADVQPPPHTPDGWHARMLSQLHARLTATERCIPVRGQDKGTGTSGRSWGTDALP